MGMTIGEPRRTVDNAVDNLGVLHNRQYAEGVRQFCGRLSNRRGTLPNRRGTLLCVQEHELTSDAGASLRRYLAHTGEIDPALLRACRGLLEVAFEGDLTEADWEHALGGMHSIITDGDVVIGHASVVQRRMLHRSVAWRAGYVEGVGVHPHWQRQGVGRLLMAPLHEIMANAYDLGALSASEAARCLYDRLGWQRWLGPTSAMTPGGIVATPEEDDGIYVYPCSPAFLEHVDRSASLCCDWRDGDVW